jgi:hypothetical protein
MCASYHTRIEPVKNNFYWHRKYFSISVSERSFRCFLTFCTQLRRTTSGRLTEWTRYLWKNKTWKKVSAMIIMSSISKVGIFTPSYCALYGQGTYFKALLVIRGRSCITVAKSNNPFPWLSVYPLHWRMTFPTETFHRFLCLRDGLSCEEVRGERGKLAAC